MPLVHHLSQERAESQGVPLSSACSRIAAPKEMGSRFMPARTAKLVMEAPLSPTCH